MVTFIFDEDISTMSKQDTKLKSDKDDLKRQDSDYEIIDKPKHVFDQLKDAVKITVKESAKEMFKYVLIEIVKYVFSGSQKTADTKKEETMVPTKCIKTEHLKDVKKIPIVEGKTKAPILPPHTSKFSLLPPSAPDFVNPNLEPIIDPSAPKESEIDNPAILVAKGTVKPLKDEKTAYDYCSQTTITHIIELIEKVNISIKSKSIQSDIKECCICLEEFTNKCLRKVTSCSHPLCTQCYVKLKSNQCPMCREPLDAKLVNKFAIISLGEKSKNGDYDSISLICFPEHKTHEPQMIKGIKSNNEMKKYFVMLLNELIKDNYGIVLHDNKNVKQWLESVHIFINFSEKELKKSYDYIFADLIDL